MEWIEVRDAGVGVAIYAMFYASGWRTDYVTRTKYGWNHGAWGAVKPVLMLA